MTDRYEVYYLFDDDWIESDIRDLVQHLDGDYDLSVPDESAMPDTKEHDETTEADIRRTLNSDTGYLEVSLPGRGLSSSLRFNTDSMAVPDLPHLKLTLRDVHFYPRDDESDADAVERTDEVYSFIADLYQYFLNTDRVPLYVYGLAPVEIEKAADPNHRLHVDLESVRDATVPGLYWCQILSAAMVADLGADRVLSAPAYRTERFEDGAILLVARHGVTTDGEPEFSESEIADHLDIPYEW